MRLLDLAQWFLSCLVPPLLGLISLRLFDRKVAAAVFLVSCLYFPLWEYFGYFISEGPFIFTQLAAFLLLVLSLQSKSGRGALAWGLAGGIALGACAVIKSCALFSAALVFALLIYYRCRHQFRIAHTAVGALIGLSLILTPVSIRATRMNEGRFLLIANDAPRTFLLGHQGRAGLTWWLDGPRNFHMNFSNPSATQHGYGEIKEYHFGPYESKPNYQAAWSWIGNNPLEALLLSIEHVFDMFAIALPWPGYFRPYAGWTIFFNEFFIALILFPALIHLLRVGKKLFQRDPQVAGDGIVAAAALSIYLLAFIFLGEGRYRICFDGFMMMLAARALFPVRPSDLIRLGST